MLQNIVNALTGDRSGNRHRVKGTVVLMKKNVLDFNDFSASFLDRLHEFVGKRVSLQLISAVTVDPGQLLFPFLALCVCDCSCSLFQYTALFNDYAALICINDTLVYFVFFKPYPPSLLFSIKRLFPKSVAPYYSRGRIIIVINKNLPFIFSSNLLIKSSKGKFNP